MAAGASGRHDRRCDHLPEPVVPVPQEALEPVGGCWFSHNDTIYGQCDYKWWYAVFAAGNDPAAKGSDDGYRQRFGEAAGAAADRRLPVVILALGPHEDGAVSGRSRLWLPLVRRVRQPFLGAWALPGGDLRAGHSLEESAFKALETTTDLHLATLNSCTPSAIRRDPAEGCRWSPSSTGRWSARPKTMISPRRTTSDGSPRTNFPNWPSTIVGSSTMPCGAAQQIEYPDIATKLVGDTFTLPQLHDVYEAVGGQPLDLANFRRKMLVSGTWKIPGRNADGTPPPGHRIPLSARRYRRRRPRPSGRHATHHAGARASTSRTRCPR